jgi:hypothetical protein
MEYSKLLMNDEAMDNCERILGQNENMPEDDKRLTSAVF